MGIFRVGVFLVHFLELFIWKHLLKTYESTLYFTNFYDLYLIAALIWFVIWILEYITECIMFLDQFRGILFWLSLLLVALIASTKFQRTEIPKRAKLATVRWTTNKKLDSKESNLKEKKLRGIMRPVLFQEHHGLCDGLYFTRIVLQLVFNFLAFFRFTLYIGNFFPTTFAIFFCLTES